MGRDVTCIVTQLILDLHILKQTFNLRAKGIISSFKLCRGTHVRKPRKHLPS